jgi:hypothetical protein
LKAIFLASTEVEEDDEMVEMLRMLGILRL